MKTHVLLFQPRFAGLVRTGAKRQTIRPPRVRAITPGDILILRTWTGKPYRSRQETLLKAKCTAVQSVEIHFELLYRGGIGTAADVTLNTFAQADGFTDWPEMIQWFQTTHTLPFTGQLIQGRPIIENIPLENL